MIVNNYGTNTPMYKRCSRCGRICGCGQTQQSVDARMFGRVEISPAALEKEAESPQIPPVPANRPEVIESPPAPAPDCPETEPVREQEAVEAADYMIGEARADTPGESADEPKEEPEEEPVCPTHLLKEGLFGRGLYHYRKWWERSDADIVVNGVMISGITIFTDVNTLRVVNEHYSYFIPLEKVDYIRTDDGLLKNP